MTSESGQPGTYVDVAARLRERVVSGVLKPGDKLTVRGLADEWSIARGTAEKALNVLRSEGLVEARSRTGGTVVCEAPPIYRRIQDRYATSRRTGRIYTQGERARITAADLVAAPDDVAQALGVQPGSPVIRRERVTLLEDAPVATSTSWFPGDLAPVAPALLHTERIREGAGAYVERVTGRTRQRGEEQLAARLATSEEADLLGLEAPAAVLETRHTAYAGDGEPVTYELGLAPPGYWTTYTYEIPPPNGDITS
jgi:GntR family transcriptional regulator